MPAPSAQVVLRPGRKLPGGVFSRPELLAVRVALIVANAAAVTLFLLSFRHGIGFGPYREDLEVYRMGGRLWLHGGDLYQQPRSPTGKLRLPFTYPPIAAVLFSPLSLMPRVISVTGSALVTIISLGVTLRVFLRRPTGPERGSLWVLGWLLPLALFIEPVRNTLWLGQINVMLMCLVSLDCLAREPRWPRGVLVGLAAAVKLTPLAFVLFFLLRRDYRAASIAAASFAVVTGVAFLLAWRDSVVYWTHVLFQISRVGGLAYAGNQSIQAVLARAGLDPQTLTFMVVWLVLSAVVLTAAARGMRYAFAADEDCWALSLNAFAALLISPISWSHHWVWCAPALLTLAILSYGNHIRISLVASAAGLTVFALAPQWWFPSGAVRELNWAIWQQVIGSSYVIFAAFVLAMSAYAKTTFTRKLMVDCRDVSGAPGPGAPGLSDERRDNRSAPCPITSHPGGPLALVSSWLTAERQAWRTALKGEVAVPRRSTTGAHLR